MRLFGSESIYQRIQNNYNLIDSRGNSHVSLGFNAGFYSCNPCFHPFLFSFFYTKERSSRCFCLLQHLELPTMNIFLREIMKFLMVLMQDIRRYPCLFSPLLFSFFKLTTADELVRIDNL